MDLIKYLSFRKIRLSLLLLISYYISYFLKKNIRWGRYVALSVEPSNRCNLSCPECPTGTQSLSRGKGELSLKDLKKILESKSKDLLYLNFYFQGEPFLNRKLTDMVRMASDEGIYTSVSTNAQQIDRIEAKKIVESGLNRIIISIDGTTQDVYEKYRVGGRLDSVIQAAKNIILEKKNSRSLFPKVVFQFLVFKHNEHQIADIKQLAKQIGVDKVEIKTAQIYNFQTNTSSIPSIDKYSRYKKDDKGVYRIKNKMPNKCWRMWHSAVITQDLDLLPCCYDKDASYKLGNLNKKSFLEIESGREYEKFRKEIAKRRSSISICRNCGEHLSL